VFQLDLALLARRLHERGTISSVALPERPSANAGALCMTAA
jgi:hypothetical protein